jgi:DNA-binding LacI/PurR family transcriptional regulator
VSAGDYNIPDWEPTLEGLQALFASLFQVTPPTALIVEEPAHLLALILHLAQRRLRVPQDVSLISLGRIASMAWCRPEVTSFYWDNDQILRRITRWVAAVAMGRPDREAVRLPLKFNSGATIAPPPLNA